ncbi:hypothetical protein M9Y10_033691 [Tritrichomonas musculus]|uniref:Uncharacterized protein n=1 Tax=Tritrichomonas musculus TaxID=1915356 RepID=A0ABR2KG33_9EUKA
MNISSSNIPIVNPLIENDEDSDDQSSDVNDYQKSQNESWKQPPVLLEYSLNGKNLDPPEIYAQKFPSHLLFNRQNEGFASKLYDILEYAGNDIDKMLGIGCGWISNDEFFLIKKRFCIVTNINLNTLNYKLRQCRFSQSKKHCRSVVILKSENFSKNIDKESLHKIDKRKIDDIVSIGNDQVLLITALDSVHNYAIDKSEIHFIKKTVVDLWQKILGRSGVFAVNKKVFLTNLVQNLCKDFKSQQNENQEISINSAPLDFSLYVSSNNLNFNQTVFKMVAYVFYHKKPDIITISDFFNFYSHFGPENDIIEKIHKLLCCSYDFGGWFLPKVQEFDYSKSISGSYSNTCSNCFVLKKARKWTSHIYNLISASSLTGYLIDESDKRFLTWHAVLEHLNSQSDSSQYHELPVT